jgi:site-specific DNA-methyltransferase (adenine-specific)
MIVEQKALTDIKPYIKNPRKKWDIQKVAQSIKEFGFQQPIVVDRGGTIIVGHGRYEASKLLKLDSIPVTIADLPPDKAKAYRIADNKTNEFSEWDISLLQQEFTDLLDANFDLELTGFDHDELESLITGEKAGLTDDDAVPELPNEPKSKLGDIYKLGEHRLMCGDSTSIDDTDKLINKERIEMMFTDPPYNVAFNGRSGKFDVIENDKLDAESFKTFISEFINTFKTLNINTYYICCNWAFYGILQDLLKPKACIVWAKNVFGLGKGYRHQHEFILFDGFIDASITNESDLWQIKKDTNYKHPTQKPVLISERAIKNSSKSQNGILDLFGGSGSTLLACEKTNRKCYMMELDPKYIDVIIKRWEDYTGKKAELLNG